MPRILRYGAFFMFLQQVLLTRLWSWLTLVLTQDQVTVLVHRDLVARITIHPDLAFLAVQLITHVVADNLVADIIDRVATLLGRGVGVTLLHALLHLVTRVTAADRAHHGGQGLAATAADQATEQTTTDRTQRRTGQSMLILHRLLPGDRDIFTDLARGLDLSLDRLYRQYLRILRAAFYQAIGGNSTPGSHTDSTQYRTHQQRLVHVNLLTITSGSMPALLLALEYKKRREFNTRAFQLTTRRAIRVKDGRRLPSGYWPEESGPRCSGSARSAPRWRCRSTSRYPPTHR